MRGTKQGILLAQQGRQSIMATMRILGQPLRRGWWLAPALLAVVLGAFLQLTPAGLLNKVDMVGYAVCHRIPSHSFAIAGRTLPLCARCSGTFLGALTGLLGQWVVLRRRRASEFPSPPIMAILVALLLFMAVDGVNSYLSMVIGRPLLYEPRQWLRLITGAFNGLFLSALMAPLVNFSLWRQPSPERAIRGWRDLLVLLALEAGMVLLVLSQWPPLLYPLALLSGISVVTMLGLVMTVLVVMAIGRENQYDGWKEAIPPLMVGFALALLMIGAIDVLRYTMTGTLEGFPGLD